MSEALLWHLIRDNNSFLVKRERTSRRGAVQFSTEPGNLMNVHCFKYSGVANNATIDISTSDLTIKTKDAKINNKPSKAFKSETLSNKLKKAELLSKSVAIVSASRPDLLAAAKVRTLKVAKGVKAKNGVKGRNRKNKHGKVPAKGTRRNK